SGATETLLAILVFGSLLCYLKHRDFGVIRIDRWQVASLSLAILAVMTKETGIILPALVCSYEWIFRPQELSRKEGLIRAVRKAPPYVLISIGFVVVRALALKRLTPPHTNVGLDSVL